jgi:hypothetical protein
MVRGETRGICTLKGKSEPVEVIHLEPPAVFVEIPPSNGKANPKVDVDQSEIGENPRTCEMTDTGRSRSGTTCSRV